ncbi:hypothetical protein RDWZM_009379 [Blomia tropicalis]|uniref:Grh/CP2 DB domain-containing protein n=1 Tax=Blomia tropicalis TaxID=40697 RepID=A0A9Q0M687_BLOTA|nr:hypothetical protein RDWZM_009379 [Blomia tropicalis]
MLNINGSSEEPQSNGSVQGLHSIYDYYKLPVVVDGVSKGITLITSDGKTVTDSSLQEMVWSAVPVSVSTADVLQNAAIVATSGSLTSSPNRHSDEEQLSNTSPINGHVSPHGNVKLEQNNHLIVTQADNLVANGNDNTSQTIIVTTSDTNQNQITGQNGQAVMHSNDVHIKNEPITQATVLHPNEVHIKSEPIDPLPPLASPAQMVDVHPAGVDRSRELEPSPPTTVISLAPAQPYPPNAATQLTFAAPTYDLSGAGQYAVQVNATTVSPQYAAVPTAAAAARSTNGGTVYLTTDYITYREYYPNTTNGSNIVVTNDQYHTVRQHLTATPSVTTQNNYNTPTNESETSFLDRYLRQQPITSSAITGTIAVTAGTATVSPSVAVASLPTNDSGMGDATTTPRPENATLPQIFDYTGLPSQAPTLLPVNTATELSVATNSTPSQVANPGSVNSNSPSVTPASATKSNRRSWHEYGRNSDIDKIQIPKLISDVGFKYYLESPISTSQRREDDRVTYINKGQFYGISLEYINDSEKPLKTATVKSIVMLVFREEKTQDEEVKAWQFWHSRQHSVKQRILDADTKNSSGIVGPIEEVAHNAIAFYWNPLEGPAKVNIAVQCLSTDFSNQKGVKGLPLHLQVDTFDDIREGSTPVHKGYCQIKVFCDKGAERKTRDEERRAAKRKMNATGNGRKKIEEMYHPTSDRSEFYSMSDLLKPPVLFTPSEDIEKITTGDINFYGHTGADLGYDADSGAIPPISTNMPMSTLHPCERTDPLGVCDLPIPCPPKKMKLDRYPNIDERVLLYAKQENEEVFHPLHLVPPTLVGLALAIENKYKLEAKNIRNIYKRCKKGITVQMDDDMVKHYSHEDTVLLEVHQIDTETHDITLVEYDSC